MKPALRLIALILVVSCGSLFAIPESGQIGSQTPVPSQAPANTISESAYEYNSIGQRSHVVNAGSAFSTLSPITRQAHDFVRCEPGIR